MAVIRADWMSMLRANPTENQKNILRRLQRMRMAVM